MSYLVSYNTTITCFFFLVPGTRFGAYDSIRLTQNPFRTCYPVGHHAKIECFCFLLFVCLSLTSQSQIRAYGDRPKLEVSSDSLVKPGIEPVTPGLQGDWFIHYTTAAPVF